MSDQRKRSGQSRRDFLGAAALAAGGFGLAAHAQRPSVRALAPWRRPVAPRSGEMTRIAIVGTGGMGRGHLGAILNLHKETDPRVEIAALCHVNDLHAGAAPETLHE